MRITRIVSDQFYNWSEEKNEETLKLYPSQASQGARAPVTSSGGDSSRLAHRALQALRQARLQMRRRTRPRSEVLPLGHTTSRPTSNGLRSTGQRRRGNRAPGALPFEPTNSRADLRDQPRATAPKRRAVGRHCGTPSDRYFYRSEGSRNPGGEHVAIGARRRPSGSRRGGD